MRGVPKFQEPELTRFLEDLLKEVTIRDKDRLSANTGNHSLLLISPGLKVFEVTVNDAGTLAVTKVSG
jgi:hypothetical protein